MYTFLVYNIFLLNQNGLSLHRETKLYKVITNDGAKLSRKVKKKNNQKGVKMEKWREKIKRGDVRTISKGYLRNIDTFEMVGHRGFYKAVGVCTGLTGTPVDVAIIDDPVKDAVEAYSSTYRERVWEWYVNVLLTRLHNDSKQLLIMTRWHEDDLAGRIIKQEGDEWDIVSIPAIKENNDNPLDPRQIGEALWEDKHSIKKLRKMERVSSRTFSSLYQQRPTIDGGNIIKKEWFGAISKQDYDYLYSKSNRPAVHFFADTAYTDKNANDPTGVIATVKLDNKIYITSAVKVRKEFPALCRFLPDWVQTNKYDIQSVPNGRIAVGVYGRDFV